VLFKNLNSGGQSAPLRDVFVHPELEKAYPELFDMPIKYDPQHPLIKAGHSGYYNSETKSIGVGNVLSRGAPPPSGKYDAWEVEGLIGHEVAHATQDLEGILAKQRGAPNTPWANRVTENLAEAQRLRMLYSPAQRKEIAPHRDYITPESEQYVDFGDDLGVSPGPRLSSDLARTIARQAPRFNQSLDTSLDLASILDPSMGYATETVRALKDLPGKVGGAGTLALAPVVGATNMLGNIGQLPEAAVGGYDALKRTLKQMRVDAERRKGTDIKTYRR